MLRKGAVAATILECNFVNPICVDDSHGGVTGNRVLAIHVVMIQLDLKAEGLQRHVFKKYAVPLLIRGKTI